MFPRHHTRVKPSIVAGRIQFSIPRLGAPADADGVGGAFQEEVASWNWIVTINDAKLNGDCATVEDGQLDSDRNKHGHRTMLRDQGCTAARIQDMTVFY